MALRRVVRLLCNTFPHTFGCLLVSPLSYAPLTPVSSTLLTTPLLLRAFISICATHFATTTVTTESTIVDCRCGRYRTPKRGSKDNLVYLNCFFYFRLNAYVMFLRNTISMKFK